MPNLPLLYNRLSSIKAQPCIGIGCIHWAIFILG